MSSHSIHKFVQFVSLNLSILAIFMIFNQLSNVPVVAQYGGSFINTTTKNYTIDPNTGLPTTQNNSSSLNNQNQVNKDKGANNLGMYIDDPYTCGDNFFGNARGGNGKLKLNVSLYKIDSNQLAYSFEVPIVNEKWVLDIDYDKVLSGKYKVVSTVTDEKGYTASYTFTAEVKKPQECTVVNNLTKVLIRTGGFVSDNSLVTFSSFGILTLACGIIFKIRHPQEYVQR